MKFAFYIGTHDKDTWWVRLGWAITRLAQRGEFKRVTHCEAVLEEHADGSTTIGSASLRDGGVRIKTCVLDKDNWIFIDVPIWSTDKMKTFIKSIEGQKYSILGAIGTCFSFLPKGKGWECAEVCGYPFIEDSFMFSPSELAQICNTIRINL
jgi:hypothetical protein